MLKLKSETVVTVSDNQIAILNSITNKAFLFEGTAKEILELMLDGYESCAMIVDFLSKKYHVGKEVIEPDVLEFISDIRTLGLLKE